MFCTKILSLILETLLRWLLLGSQLRVKLSLLLQSPSRQHVDGIHDMVNIKLVPSKILIRQTSVGSPFLLETCETCETDTYRLALLPDASRLRVISKRSSSNTLSVRTLFLPGVAPILNVPFSCAFLHSQTLAPNVSRLA